MAIFSALLATALLPPLAAAQAFSVAEVKPHYQCTASPEGADRVRAHVGKLTAARTGIIGLIQFELELPQPEKYTAFGASCFFRNADPVVVLVDSERFEVLQGLGDTIVGNYSAMPFLSKDASTTGSMCVSEPGLEGERGYTGAKLRHRSSGQAFCTVAGTFPHCYGPWRPEFLRDLEACKGLPMLLVVDTNAACEKQGPLASKNTSLTAIGRNYSAGWGECSDPGTDAPKPTCCHDLKWHHPEPTFWYDRTALCGSQSGSVRDFVVEKDFVCLTDQEHKYTTANVDLGAQMVYI